MSARAAPEAAAEAVRALTIEGLSVSYLRRGAALRVLSEVSLRIAQARPTAWLANRGAARLPSLWR